MIWSVVVTYEAPDIESAEADRREIEEILDEHPRLGMLTVGQLAQVAPLVQLPEDYWESAE